MSTTRKIVKAKFEIEVEIDEDQLSEPYEFIIAREIVSGNAEINLIKQSPPWEVPQTKQDLPPVSNGDKISIPAWSLELFVGGNTIWVISPTGATLMRTKTFGKIEVESCKVTSTSHCDIELKEDINFCISKDANI